MALLLPAIVVIALAIVQICVVAADGLAVVEAARAAARETIVAPDRPDRVRSAAVGATRLKANRLLVSVRGSPTRGSLMTVTVTYRAPTDVALVGRLVGDVSISERFVVRSEGPNSG
jgi:hypothetical protein